MVRTRCAILKPLLAVAVVVAGILLVCGLASIDQGAEPTAPGSDTAKGSAQASGNGHWFGTLSTMTAAEARTAERVGQVRLLSEVFGNPFRPPSLPPHLLAWNDGTVPRLARAIYDERAFDRLPILADALEDAGCTNADLLSHLRGPGPHVRGCWALDLLLGKE